MFKSLSEIRDWDSAIQYADLKTGIRMAYVEAGDSEKPAVVFLHGHTDTGRSYKVSASAIEKDHRLIMPDLRGYGHSDKPEVFAYSITEMANDILALMDALGIEKASVVGFSMGSFVAQAVSFSAPDRIEKLMLISSGARMNETAEDVAAVIEDLKAAYNAEKDEEFISGWIPTYQIFDQETLKYYWENLKKISVQSWVAGWLALSLADHRKFLQFIKCPVTIIWGREDGLFVEELQNELRQLLPQADFIPFDNTHEILGENSARVGEEFARFFV